MKPQNLYNYATRFIFVPFLFISLDLPSLAKRNADSLDDQTVSISREVKISKKSNKQLQVQTLLDESCWAIDEHGNHVRVPCP